ncbi:transglycosylase SLT domain-containing protein [Vibrio renipiscarius]|uniref:Murein transglycosylase n=1 Tax=Vibrio renipiscarius TaxID=1461322 RepID=A0A0C2P1I6_9VIBR|nr:transglycosylase SLT domain-containing protein [Vibrio renipiscarius]KII82165.1 murein transglycosylase [Vibrio renipiscarius]KII82219.1 murein transglycosylase [Vibrio renipiscarius]
MLRKNISLLATTVALVFSNVSSAEDAFDDLRNAINKANTPQQQKIAEFHQWLDQYFSQYEAWRVDYTTELDKERSVLIDKWGSGEVSNATRTVEYDGDIKKVIDYQNNTAVVSVLVDADQQENGLKPIQQFKIDGQTISLKHAQKKEVLVDYSIDQEKKEKQFVVDQVQTQLRQLDVQADRLIAANTGAPADFIYQRAQDKKMALIQSATLRVAAISAQFAAKREQLGINVDAVTKTSSEQPVTAKKAVNPSADVVPTSDLVAEKALPQKIEKKVINYTVKIPDNNLSAAAAKYRPLAVKEGEKWGIDTALIMAIMHNESSFRPKIVSGAPAYGLMQIVPTSAGHDVNRRVRKIDAPMTPEDLFVPEINVEAGTVYLRILQDNYLSKIKDEQSRVYCMIAAYNTGAGNVGRAFNPDGAMNLDNAIGIINTMTPEEVYQQLLDRLPHVETKTYLSRVTASLALY